MPENIGNQELISIRTSRAFAISRHEEGIHATVLDSYCLYNSAAFLHLYSEVSNTRFNE